MSEKPVSAALEASEIALNNATVTATLAEIELHKAQAYEAGRQGRVHDFTGDLGLIQKGREELKDKFDGAQDYRHGYVELCMEITPGSVDTVLHTLRRLNRLYPGKAIVIELNSPGGHIVEGFRLIDEIVRLQRDGHHVTIRVRGMAASMAAVLLQVADRREIGPSAFFMIHRAAFGAMGKAYEIEDQVEFVKMLEKRIVDLLVAKSTKGRAFFSGLFNQRKDIWLDAEKTVAYGLADVVA